MLLAWVAFPLVLALVGAGWGLLCGDLFGAPIDGALVIPLGVAAVIVVAGLLTLSSAVAPATVVVVAVLAAIGLIRHRHRLLRLDPWAVGMAVFVLVAFGAPVILSGQATFAGYQRLDDTATWLSIVDRVMSHGRSLAALAPSTYQLNLHEYLNGMGYPLGSFLPWGVGRALVGVDAAWVFQPYLSFCGMLVGLVVYWMGRRLIPARWLRALVAFLAAQPALLYGYSQWGGIKELCAAYLVILLAAVASQAVAFARSAESERRRARVGPLAVICAAAAITLGPGSAAWLAPALGVVVVFWLWRASRGGWLRGAWMDVGALAGGVAVAMLPVWLSLGRFLAGSSELFQSQSGNSAHGESGLVSLFHPLSVFQLGGVWPVGDFRLTAPAAATVPLLVVVWIGVLLAWLWRIRDEVALAIYPGLALLGCLIVWLAGSDAWVVAKAMAIGSPALLAVGALGAGGLAGGRLSTARRTAGAAVLGVVAVGVLWSNALAYHDVTLAPKPRLAELQHVAGLLHARGPTFINEYEIYADRHFLRDAAPVEPAEYRTQLLALTDGRLLTKGGQADLDAFPVTTLSGFPSIVTQTSPVASRPPSIYRLRWQGTYYQLWQRPAHPTATILEHVPLGDSTTDPFCGQSTAGYEPVCPTQPVGVASCRLVKRLAATASREHAELVAYQRPAPVVALADQTRWPSAWAHDPSAHTLTPTAPGTLIARIRVDGGQRYALWLGGSFARGFQVSLDGRRLGQVEDQLQNLGQFIEVGQRRILPGIHTITLTYPQASLAPGSGAKETLLSAIVLEPLQVPASTILTVTPQHAGTLCGRSLDWIELVGRAPA